MALSRTQQLMIFLVILAVLAIAITTFHTQLMHALLLPMPGSDGCTTHGC